MLKLVVDRGRCGSVDTAARSAVTASAGNDLGSASGCLGLPIIGIGLAPISSVVNRKVHNTFQVDQAAPDRGGLVTAAYSANAELVASAPVVGAARSTGFSSDLATPASQLAIKHLYQ